MSHPHQPDEHGRTTGGVRGAINDLLGRGDNADRTDRDRTADDRTAESERPEQERSGAGADAGLPTGARFDGQPTEGRPAADPRPTGQAPAEAPTGARFEGQPADARATADPSGPSSARGIRRPPDLATASSSASAVPAPRIVPMSPGRRSRRISRPHWYAIHGQCPGQYWSV